MATIFESVPMSYLPPTCAPSSLYLTILRFRRGTYDAGKFEEMGDSLVSLRDHTEHIRRRKIWAKGFTSSALREYTPLVVNRTKQLAAVFEEHAVSGEALDVSKWMSYFTFDLMGDFACVAYVCAILRLWITLGSVEV